MTLKTILNETHRALGAKMVDFGGWDMPIHYGSQIDEHHLVRQDAGMFDVSHMTVVDLRGAGVRDFLRRLVANSVDKLKIPGKALYTCMLNEQGGVVDDLIVDTRVMKARYMVVDLARTGRSGAASQDGSQILIPLNRVRVDATGHRVELDVTGTTTDLMPRFTGAVSPGYDESYPRAAPAAPPHLR